MDWFRGRSLRAQEAPDIIPSTPSAPAAAAEGGKQRGSAHPSSRATSGTPSDASRDTGVTVPEEPTAQQPTSKAATAVASQAAPASSTAEATATTATKLPKPFNEAMLRYHHGAVDQRALSSLQPQEMLVRVRAALASMGIDFGLSSEEEFKLECLRPKRGGRGGIGAWGTNLRTSVFPPTQTDLERASRQPSRPGGRVLAPPPIANAGLAASKGAGTGAGTPTGPVYGQASVDNGQEVRFSVEITRLQNLPGLYSLDIRRMRGNVWAYKFCYTALLQRCDLSPNTPSIHSASSTA